MLTRVKAFFVRLPIGFTVQALIYPILLIGALIFAQVNKTALSHMVFVFILILPLGALLQIVVAVLSVRASVRVSKATVEKKAVVSLFVNVTNKGPLPLAFVEAELMLPSERVSCSDTARTMMTLLPFSSSQIARGIEFPRRGEYDVGISCIYVYDLTRSVRVRVNMRKTQKVFVLPRRLSLPPREAYGEEWTAQASRISQSADSTESFDTRLYAVGDSLKRVHWKLSSKSEDIIVRDNASRLGASVCVMCDLEPYFSDSAHEGIPTPREENAGEIDCICADAVVEMALAIVLRELRAQNTVVLAWIERGEAVSVRLTSLADYEAVFRRFGSAPLDEMKGHIRRIRDSVDLGDAALIIVSPYLTKDRAREYAAHFGGVSRFAAPTLLLFSDESLFLPDKTAQTALNERVRELTDAGFDVIKFKT